MVLPRRERNSGAGSLSGCTEGPTFVAMEGISMAADSSCLRSLSDSSGVAAYLCVWP